jgi:chemotaxis regulatin CheY-phosphate phosphatase CheZ
MTTDLARTNALQEDFDAIEAAVMETERGRWFLAEHARRNRHADTLEIVSSIERLEKVIQRERAVPDIDRIRLDLADMAEAIARTKQEIFQMKHETEDGGRFADASRELDAIVNQTERATNEILLNAEQIQELAWLMREAKVPDEYCDKLDNHSTDIYTACSFQDLTGQRTRKVVTVLRYLESRINAMMGIWGVEFMDATVTMPDGSTGSANFEDTRPDAHLLNGPQLEGEGINQSSIDDLMNGELVEGDDLAFLDEAALQALGVELAAPPDTAGVDASAHVHDDLTLVERDADAVFAAVRSELMPEPAADVFAAPEAKGKAKPAPTPFADPALFVEADVFVKPAEAGSIAPAPKPKRRRSDGPAPADAKPVKPAVVGNTALAVAPEPAAEPEPVLAVVPADDPIAALSAREKLTLFG